MRNRQTYKECEFSCQQCIMSPFSENDQNIWNTLAYLVVPLSNLACEQIHTLLKNMEENRLQTKSQYNRSLWILYHIMLKNAHNSQIGLDLVWQKVYFYACACASLVAQTVKDPLVMFRSLGWENSVEKEMAVHSSILAWRIPWTEEPSRLHSSLGHKESDTTEQLTH